MGSAGLALIAGLLSTLSPCVLPLVPIVVGPTLGAASVLAARSENLPNVAFTMAAFGLGAALPLLAIGMMSREALMRWRERMLSAGRGGKAALGALLVALGLLIVSGLDKR